MLNSPIDNTETLTTIFRWILGVTLLLAGVPKVRNPSAFVAGVLRYQILPSPFARLYGRIIPFLEVIAGVFLILGVRVKFASFVSLLLFASFSIAVALNLLRKRKLPCYCFGTNTVDNMGLHTFLRILVLLTFAGFLALAHSTYDPFWAISARPSFVGLMKSLPLLFIAMFVLLLLSLLDILPWIIQAWTAKAVAPPKQRYSIAWVQDSSSERV